MTTQIYTDTITNAVQTEQRKRKNYYKLTDRRRYLNQKVRAKHRGIDFHFTFEEWLEWWQNTGYYDLRGKGRGLYCMARYGDQGPYAPWNVECLPYEMNSVLGNQKRGL